MCHGQFNTSKTIRFKADEPHHKNAVPYKRKNKYKEDYLRDYK